MRRLPWLFAWTIALSSTIGCDQILGIREIDADGSEGGIVAQTDGASEGGANATDTGSTSQSDGSPEVEGGERRGQSDASLTGTNETGATGNCNDDNTIICANSGQTGFSCAGTAPPQTYSAQLSCNMGTPGGGGMTQYCCSGNWCADPGSASDSAGCRSCYVSNCGAPGCQCDEDRDVDDAGTAYCWDFYACVVNCFGGTSGAVSQAISGCESTCAPGYSQNAVAEGSEYLACLVQACALPCGFN